MSKRKSILDLQYLPFPLVADGPQLVTSANTVVDAQYVVLEAGLYLYNAGYFAEGNALLELSVQLFGGSFFNCSEESLYSLTRRACEFTWAATGSMPSTSGGVWAVQNCDGNSIVDESPWSEETLAREELLQRMTWTNDPHLQNLSDRTIWKSCKDSHPHLRAGLQLVAPSNGELFGSQKVREELEALRTLIAKYSKNTPHDDAAICCTIEVAATCNEPDVAFELANSYVRGNAYRRNWSGEPNRLDVHALLTCRHFVHLLAETASSPTSPHRNALMELRGRLGVTDDLAPSAPARSETAIKSRLSSSGPLRPLKDRSLKELLDIINEKAAKAYEQQYTKRGVDLGNGIVRPGASAQDIVEAEQRIDYVLPDDYKELLRIGDGWQACRMGCPSLASVKDIHRETFCFPIGIGDTSGNEADTFISLHDDCIPDDPRRLFLIQDKDLKLDGKRFKGEDGTTYDYQPGRYRLVEVVSSGTRPVYSNSLHEWLESVVQRLERKITEIERLRKFGIEVVDVESESDTEINLPLRTPQQQFIPPSSPPVEMVLSFNQPVLPDCWYGRECRTQHHNHSHAARFNHNCDNTHKT